MRYPIKKIISTVAIVLSISTTPFIAFAGQYDLNMDNVMNSDLVRSVPGCGNITNKISSTFTNIISDAGTTAVTLGLSMAMNGFKSVPTSDFLAPLTANIQKDIKENLSVDKFRSECINGIANKMSKLQLADMTKNTMNWVSQGYNGDPLFIRDRASFFKGIENTKLTEVVDQLKNVNPSDFPYGKDFAKNLIQQQKISFEDQARSTLDSALAPGATAKSFSQNFNAGGWDGYLALGNNPANNPIGFSMMAAQHVEDEQKKAIENQKEELTSSGFLSQKKCKEYDESTPPKCTSWETVTPGSVIAEMAKTALTSPMHQLELANDMNSSLDKVFGKLIDNLQNGGLSGLKSYAYSSDLGGAGRNKVTDVGGNTIADKQILKAVDGGNGWSNAGDKPFNILRDLGDKLGFHRISLSGGGTTYKQYTIEPGIISIQQNYVKQITNPKTGSLRKIEPVMTMLGRLDYCIPGPTPLWKKRTQLAVRGMKDYIESLQWQKIQASVGTSYWQIVASGDVDQFFADSGIDTTEMKKYLNDFIKGPATGTPTSGCANLDPEAKKGSLEEVMGCPEARRAYLENTNEALKKKMADLDSAIEYHQNIANNNQDDGWFGSGSTEQKHLNERLAQENRDALNEILNDTDTLLSTIKKNKEMEVDDLFKQYTSMIEKNYESYYEITSDNTGKITYTSSVATPSPLRDFGKSSYLVGIEDFTQTSKNILSYAQNVETAKDQYRQLVEQSSSNITTLKRIKKEVDFIVAKAKCRRLHKVTDPNDPNADSHWDTGIQKCDNKGDDMLNKGDNAINEETLLMCDGYDVTNETFNVETKSNTILESIMSSIADKNSTGDKHKEFVLNILWVGAQNTSTRTGLMTDSQDVSKLFSAGDQVIITVESGDTRYNGNYTIAYLGDDAGGNKSNMITLNTPVFKDNANKTAQFKGTITLAPFQTHTTVPAGN